MIYKITSGRIQNIFLLGGEPLLHPDVNKFAIISRKYFKNSFIAIFTNGILLNKQNDDFWKICKENKISIIITKYPININFDKIIDICNKNNIGISFSAPNNDKKSYNFSLDITGNQDKKYSFFNCDERTCNQIYNGKFYMCSIAAYIEHFNKYFNQNLKVTKKDYLELDKTSLKDLKKYISNPIPFCKYCYRPINIIGPWRPSKKVIEEYLYNSKK